jgi:protein phosphatase
MSEVPLVEMIGLSDVGRVREHNEDAIRWNSEAGWAILADGMGGHLAGEVASAMAVEIIAAQLSVPLGGSAGLIEERLTEAIAEANRAIHQRAQAEPQCNNMGTTVVAVAVREGWLYCAHVGDSRLYRFNGNGLSQLTHDHSLVQELVDEGMMSSEEAAGSRHRNVITRALGLEERVESDIMRWQVTPGERYLLCSDGLSDPLGPAVMAEILAGSELSQVAQTLLDEANSRGGEDNISLILLGIGGR